MAGKGILKWVLLAAGAVVVLAILAIAAGLWFLAAQFAPGVSPGDPAPAMTMTALDGKAVNLGDYRGKVVLIDFWASW